MLAIAYSHCRGIGEELRNACKWIGSEKLLCPLLQGLVKRYAPSSNLPFRIYLIFKVRLGDEDALSLLESIITAPQVPIVAIRRSANTLISYAISDKAPVQMSTAHRLLTTIKQRHPAAFNKAADALCEEDKDIKASVEQLIISLSVVRRHAVHQPIFLGAYFTVL